jgi:hypothetical protein
MIIEMLLDGRVISEWVFEDPAKRRTLTRKEKIFQKELGIDVHKYLFQENADASEKAVQLQIQDIKNRCWKMIEKHGLEKDGGRISFCVVFRSSLNEKDGIKFENKVSFR